MKKHLEYDEYDAKRQEILLYSLLEKFIELEVKLVSQVKSLTSEVKNLQIQVLKSEL